MSAATAVSKNKLEVQESMPLLKLDRLLQQAIATEAATRGAAIRRAELQIQAWDHLSLRCVYVFVCV